MGIEDGGVTQYIYAQGRHIRAHAHAIHMSMSDYGVQFG